MPLPFIPIAIALGAVAAGGTVAGALGLRDKTKSNKLNQEAQQTISDAEALLKSTREATQTTLEKLGTIKLKLWSSQVNDFIKYYALLHNVSQEFTQGENSMFSGLSETELKCTIKTASSFAEISNIGVTALGSGALAGLGAYSGVMLFGAASTGTAISTLSGVAATNATLAWLGGGTLAAGGMGVAGGIAILGGIVAAPILAIGGTLFAISAKNALDQARRNVEKANDIKKELEEATEKLGAVSEVAELYYLFLTKLEPYSNMAVSVIQQLIKNNGLDFAAYPKSEQDKLRYVCGIIRTLTETLNTTIMTDAGILDNKSLEQFTTLNIQSVQIQEQFNVVYKLTEEELDLLQNKFDDILARYGLGITSSFEDVKTSQNWNCIYSKIINKEVDESDKGILALIAKHIEYLKWKEFLIA